jgi:putative ABC transport system ATP-binding protein
MTLIQLQDVSKSYSPSGEILSKINLSVNRAEFVVVRGRSGIGKSTLLRVLGLLDSPTSGKVLVNGELTGKMSDIMLSDLRLHSFGFVFQQFNLIPALTNSENVELPMELAKRIKSRDERRARAQDLLRSFGVADHAKKYPDEISVGEQQRVAIARALANHPAIIIADEPTASVDEKNSELITKYFERVNEENQVAIVLATTSTSEKYGRSTTEVHLEAGSLVKS